MSCKKCNNYFSKLERELYQKSPVALMRSNAGIQGYSKNNKNRPATLKYNEILSYVHDFDIVYEVG